MSRLVVVERPGDWSLDLPGVEVVSARQYLTDPEYSTRRRTRVFNLCRSYRYQRLGYYVSLLAAARGHRPLPSVSTVQDLRSPTLVRVVTNEVEDLVQKSLRELTSGEFTLSIYFGRSIAKRHARLAQRIFQLFPAPFLRADFFRRGDRWTLRHLRLLGARHIPESHRELVRSAAHEFFARGPSRPPTRPASRYDLAVLVDPDEADPPSDEGAIRRFVRAAETLGIGVDVIGNDDFAHIAEYDALFIRQTTWVDHPSYRFSRRATAEGLVVIDDPDSILRCTNKVFLAESLTRAGLPTPRTVIVHRDNLESAADELGFPCIVKIPDSSFSLGVSRLDDRESFLRHAREALEQSDLLLGQEWLPTEFDWRVGVLDRKPLYVCRYHMARGHWQIVQRDRIGRRTYGRVETLAVEEAPKAVVDTGLAAANLIGDGLYGVDLKERDGKVYVIEVNDNPNLDAGYEDALLGDELWQRIARVFLDRLERRTAGGAT